MPDQPKNCDDNCGRTPHAVRLFIAALLSAFLLALPVNASAASSDARNGEGLDRAHKGLGPGVQVPSWAEERHIHFLPTPENRPAFSYEKGQSPHGALGQPCEEKYCPTPPLYYFGGHIQTHPHVYLLFWGSNWNQEPGAADRSQLINMFETISGTSYMEILTQYFGYEGTLTPTIALTSYTETGERSFSGSVLKSLITEKGWSHTVNDQFVLLREPGTKYSGEQNYCALHELFAWSSTEATTLSVDPYPGDKPFTNCLSYDPVNKDPGNVLSFTASHEFAESVTDPFINAWLTKDGYEVTDICSTPADRLYGESGPWVSGQWDNHQNACSLADSNPPHLSAATSAASGISQTEATLNGSVNPGGKATTYHFEYSDEAVLPPSTYKLKYENPVSIPTPSAELGSGTSTKSVSQTATELKPSTRYHVRTAATNADGTTRGLDTTFVTKGPPKNIVLPTIAPYQAIGGTPETVTSVGEWLNPGDYSYQWLRCDKSAENCVPISGATSDTYVLNINDLQHRLRVEVTSKSAEGSGSAISSFTYTIFHTPPGVITEAASGISAKDATLNGKVNPAEWPTTYQFQYGQTTGYGKVIPATPQEIGKTKEFPGYDYLEVNQTLKSLEPNATYHYRLKAINQGGTTYGEDKTFTTTRSFQAPTYASSFGSKGSGNGQFEEPQDLTVDPSGNVWVADTLNSRVQKFNSKGEYQCQLGSWGGSEGEFVAPVGVGADSEGNVWVADSGYERVVQVGPECKYVSQFGLDFSPIDLAVDPSGNLWVADSGNSRIQKLSAKGEFLASCGSKGTANGQFEAAPLSIATDADGNAWAGDEAGRMEKFGPHCDFVAKFDKEASGSPAKVQPADIAIDPEGNLWVPSTEAHGVQGFYPEGEYLVSFGKEGTGEGQFSEPNAIAAGSDGTLWVIDHSSSANRIEKWVPGKAYAVVTGRAKAPKRTEATLTGKVNPEGKATSYQFEYGTTAAFGSVLPATAKSIGSGTEAVSVSELLDGLKAGTTYYYHLVATSGESTTYGETRHFTTLAKAGANARWRVGGQTFAELGVKEVPVGFEGKLTIKLWIAESPLELDCDEFGSGTLTAEGVSSESVKLYCTVKDAPEGCEAKKPATYLVNGSYESKEGFIAVLLSEDCNFLEGTVELSNPAGSFEYGSEAKALNVNVFAEAEPFGEGNPTISSDSRMFALGEYAGKAIGLEEGRPEAATQAATAIGDTQATPHGTVNPLGLATTYRFEYGTTTSYGSSAPLTGKSAGSGTSSVEASTLLSGLSPKTTYHYRILATSNGGVAYGKDMTFTTLAQPNPNWRIEGSTLEELGAFEAPYKSTGSFDLQATVLNKTIKAAIHCKESGSGTLGFSVTINLTGCEVEINGEEEPSCKAKDSTFKLNGEFQPEKGKVLTTLLLGEECVIGEEVPIEASGLTMAAGVEAVKFGALLSAKPTVLDDPEAQLSISSSWQLTGKYEGQQFAYADPEALNPNWRIEGSSLAELGAWEPYESAGSFDLQATVLNKTTKAAIHCKESGSGTLGFSETINVSGCEVEINGEEEPSCKGNGAPFELNGEFQLEKGKALTTLLLGEECVIGAEVPIEASGLAMAAGPEAVKFGADFSAKPAVLDDKEAQLSIESNWQLTGKYKGDEFGYE